MITVEFTEREARALKNAANLWADALSDIADGPLPGVDPHEPRPLVSAACKLEIAMMEVSAEA